MPYRIEINRQKCIGAATCVTEAPATFRLDDEDHAVVINARGDDAQWVLWAAQGCPVGAITLWHEDTGEEVS